MGLHQIQCVAVPAFASLVVMMPPLARAQTPEQPGAKVHGVGSLAAEIVREGRERSPTFRKLVNEPESSDWIVFVQTGSCRLPRILGCLLHRVGTFAGRHYMRIVLSDVS